MMAGAPVVIRMIRAPEKRIVFQFIHDSSFMPLHKFSALFPEIDDFLQ